MTLRERLNLRKRRVMCFLVPAFLLLSIGCCLSVESSKSIGITLILPGLAALGVATVYGSAFACRCPKCKVLWQDLARGNPLSIDRRIRYCPFCGVDIDTKEDPLATSKGASLLD